ncbi:MAG TPA: hypothetical protein PLD84_15270, partial [Chitinophagales bacterium]|nr:hypothetical protein [Chitinophagales bacterium]
AALSPDGKYVAYAADEFGKQSLYFSQINTDNAKRLMPPAESPYEGLTFAPDGSHLYFTRREVNQLSTLYRLAVLSDEPPQKLVSLRSSSLFHSFHCQHPHAGEYEIWCSTNFLRIFCRR